MIDMMGDVDLGGAVTLDYSEASLSALEAAARNRLGDPAEALDDEHQSFTAGVVAYLGMALMRVGGGRWDWVAEAPAGTTIDDPLLRRRLPECRWRIDSAGEPDATGFPIIRPDPASGLEGLSLTHLLLQALASDEIGFLVATYGRCKEVVQAYAAQHPDWSPIKERTLADGLFNAPPPSTVLDEWLARQERHFPEWATGNGGNWDYSPDSINRLATLVLRLTPTIQAFHDSANAEFVDGACYYLGEMLRRGYPSRWVYRDFRDEGAPLSANFKIQLNDDAGFTSPYALLYSMIECADPSDTRTFYDEWVS
ncbi:MULTISPECIES: hypothetical protein [Mycobacterium]|nr:MULTISPECIES: hypothetical protein [Mycobacterium]MDM4139010.1 hypothetical protein [Mycobacterium sp. FLAC0960]